MCRIISHVHQHHHYLLGRWRCNHVDSEECHCGTATPGKVQEGVDIAIENDVIVAIGDA